MHIRWRANYFLCLVIGAYCEAIGNLLRVILRNNLHSIGLYIAQYAFVVLSVSMIEAVDGITLIAALRILGRRLHPSWETGPTPGCCSISLAHETEVDQLDIRS